MTYEAKFIKLRVLTGSKGETTETIYPLTLIKNISHVEQASEIIHELTPVIGKCGVMLFDGSQVIVDYTLDEMAQILNAVDAIKLIDSLREKNNSVIQ